MRNVFLFIGLILLTILEILRVYFIMPFPGSQERNMVSIAYLLDQHIGWLRIVLLAALAYPAFRSFKTGGMLIRIALTLTLILYGTSFYFFNFRFLADKMFYQPTLVQFADSARNRIGKEKLVLGIVFNGVAKAYPIQLIGYHHQVRDNIGGEDVMVTYCTVCRTGRVYQPKVRGKMEDFRLVGMDQFNAMFEDAATKSWWRQATGEAVAGPLKGEKLMEIPARQMTLEAWLSLYPGTQILQPDPIFQKQYDDLADYDNGSIKSSLEYRDTASWKTKSWVVGIVQNGVSKAYDWNQLLRNKIISDSLPGLPLLVVMENDGETFHTWSRRLDGKTLDFQLSDSPNEMKDTNTGSTWSFNGTCTAGPMKGAELELVQSYQEFWHSWKTFHPQTLRY